MNTALAILLLVGLVAAAVLGFAIYRKVTRTRTAVASRPTGQGQARTDGSLIKIDRPQVSMGSKVIIPRNSGMGLTHTSLASLGEVSSFGQPQYATRSRVTRSEGLSSVQPVMPTINLSGEQVPAQCPRSGKSLFRSELAGTTRGIINERGTGSVFSAARPDTATPMSPITTPPQRVQALMNAVVKLFPDAS